MLRILSVLLLGLLAGCMSTEEQLAVLQENNAISATPSTSPGFDYTVLIRNLRPLGVDPTLRADRERIVAGYLGAKCPTPTIVDETELTTNQPMLSKSSKDYAVRVACARS